MVSARAETRVSGPMWVCNSPMAIVSASLAFWRAVWRAVSAEEVRRVTEERPSNPTAMTVRRINRESVTTKAKPLAFVGVGLVFMDGFCGNWVFGFRQGIYIVT